MGRSALLPCLFQSTFPRGERRSAWAEFLELSLVSIHVPTRGTTSTVPRVSKWIYVSIHVPTRGTTEWEATLEHPIDVSIHVPTRGTTIRGIQRCGNHKRFQSTFPRGERLDVFHQFRIARDVSIHVPTRGTTAKPVENIVYELTFQSTFPRGERPIREARRVRTLRFNPRSHEGNDANSPKRSPDSTRFQSTFPRGERRITWQ